MTAVESVSAGRKPREYIPGLVTVVMPAYNVGPYAAESIRSVLAQTYEHFELIVVDDGSTDDTAKQIGDVQDERLTLTWQPNAGSSAARNTGIAQGRGEFLAFIDGDDVWMPEKLSRHVALLQANPKIDLTFAWSRIVDERGADTGRRSVPVSGSIFIERLFARNIIGNGSAVVLRRAALDAAGWFDPDLRAAVEHDVWLRIALLREANVHGIAEVLSLYRMRAGQVTKDWRRMETAWKRLVAKMELLAPDRVRDVLAESRGHMYRYLAYIAYENREFSQAAAHLRAAIRACPSVVLRDRGTWIVSAGVLVRAGLGDRLHSRLDAAARRLRGRRGRSNSALALLALFAPIAGTIVLGACRKAEAYPAFPPGAGTRLAGFNSAEPTAKAYDGLFAYFIEGWETYQRPSGAAADVPGLPSRHGKDVDALEAFARTAPLVGAWLHSGRAREVVMSNAKTVDLVQLLVRGIRAGTNPNGPAYWGEMRDLDQRIVEASDIALTLWLTRDMVWPALSPDEQQNALRWLDEVNGKRLPDNNWHLFVPFVNAVRKTLGGSDERASSAANYERFKSFYKGDGWFSDGPSNAFDYYNGWAIHYQLFWLNEVDPTWDPAFIADTERQFLASYKYLIGPAGIPMLGRSVCYRMAAPTPLVYGAMRHSEVISPSDARRAVDAVWTYFIRQGAMRDGRITQGYCGDDPRIVDNYSGPSSCLWALRSLIPAFYQPSNAPFWTEPAGKLVIDTASYSVPIKSIGWTIEGDAATKRIRVINADSLPAKQTQMQPYGAMRKLATKFLWRPFRPDNDAAKYKRGEYDSDRPFCGCVAP